ncbi:MAG: hypothetical protein C7B44_11750 [Sulfobacillus thermosulfidooxidans]|nr:MAG: hypothetical protein C7B44_11750 [Sulfobacillus thermosulfidooxidans]
MRSSWQSLETIIHEAVADLGERVIIHRHQAFSTMTWVVVWTRDDNPYSHQHEVWPPLWRIRAGTSWALWEAQTASTPVHWTLKYDKDTWTEVGQNEGNIMHKAQQAFLGFLGRIPPPTARSVRHSPCALKIREWIWQGLLWTTPFLFWRTTRLIALGMVIATTAVVSLSYVLDIRQQFRSRIHVPPVPRAYSPVACLTNPSCAIAHWEITDPDAPSHHLFQHLQNWLVEEELPFELHARRTDLWRLSAQSGASPSVPSFLSITLVSSGYAIHWYYDVYDWDGNYVPLVQDALIWSGSCWLYHDVPLEDSFLPLLRKKLAPHAPVP